jgi:hypothetical protein
MGNNKAKPIQKQCATCEIGFWIRPSRRSRKYCSQTCSRGKQGAWKRPYEWMYNRLVKTCEQTKWALELTYEDFRTFTFIDMCHYCDAKIPWQPYATRAKNGCAYYLDRKDSFKGYSVYNCVVCCSRCNQSKSNSFTYEQWVEIGRVIKSFAEA